MALPIEATPVLDEENWVHLMNRMKYWEENPKPAIAPEIDPAVIERGMKAMAQRRAARLAQERSNDTDEVK